MRLQMTPVWFLRMLNVSDKVADNYVINDVVNVNSGDTPINAQVNSSVQMLK